MFRNQVGLTQIGKHSIDKDAGVKKNGAHFYQTKLRYVRGGGIYHQVIISEVADDNNNRCNHKHLHFSFCITAHEYEEGSAKVDEKNCIEEPHKMIVAHTE